MCEQCLALDRSKELKKEQKKEKSPGKRKIKDIKVSVVYKYLCLQQQS